MKYNKFHSLKHKLLWDGWPLCKYFLQLPTCMCTSDETGLSGVATAKANTAEQSVEEQSTHRIQ